MAAESSDNKMITEIEDFEKVRSTKEMASLSIARFQLQKIDFRRSLDMIRKALETTPLDQVVRSVNSCKNHIEACTRSMVAEDDLLVFYNNYFIKSILTIDPNFNLDGSPETKKQDKRESELNSWVAELGIPGLVIGEAKKSVRPRGAEALGIYINNEYKGDVFSIPPFVFQKKDFKDEVAKLLLLETEIGLSRIKVLCSPEVKKAMDATGMSLKGETLFLSRDRQYSQLDLYNGGENARIEFEAGSQEGGVIMKITEKAGDIIQYTFPNGKFNLASRRVI